MAITQQGDSAQPEEQGESSRDPILQKLASTNTFDSDWPTLRSHLHQALASSRDTYVRKGRPSSAWEKTVANVGPYTYPHSSPRKEERKDDKPPSDSLLLSPTTAKLLADHHDEDPNDDPGYLDQYGLLPSTQGGLVIAPFPPPVQHTKAWQGGGPKANGTKAHPSVTDPEWNEEVVIGGKLLPGYLDEDESKKEVERVGKLLDDLDEPPFTLQRLAELLLDPTSTHSTLGKFLRAVEKTLLVTTAWEAPSYEYTPAEPTLGSGMFTRSASFSSSSAGSDEDSLMPPGASTPMFSPIPFLRHPDSEALGMEVEGDGLMSPLSLGTGNGRDGAFTSETFAVSSLETGEQEPSSSPPEEGPSSPDEVAGTRSPAPEPEDPSLQAVADTSASPAYLGRVDELDTGPLTSENGQPQSGDGETGTMTPHGMSDHPVALSSTTVITEEEERKIAGLPRGAQPIKEAE